RAGGRIGPDVQADRGDDHGSPRRSRLRRHDRRRLRPPTAAAWARLRPGTRVAGRLERPLAFGMCEERLLALVARYLHLVALARRARTDAVFPLLGRLERLGLVTVRGTDVRLTRHGKAELALRTALARIL